MSHNKYLIDFNLSAIIEINVGALLSEVCGFTYIKIFDLNLPNMGLRAGDHHQNLFLIQLPPYVHALLHSSVQWH